MTIQRSDVTMTTYALVDGQTITVGVPESVDGPDGLIVGLTDEADPALLASLGIWPVVEVHDPLGADQHEGPAVLTFNGSTVTATYPAVDDTPQLVNKRTMEAQLRQAIADNVAILATVQQGQALVDQVASDGATLSSANIPNVAAAQVALRGVGTNLERIATVQGGTITAVATSLTQLTKLARLMLGELDGTNGGA